MTHKQECINTAMQYLEQLSIAYAFSMSIFNHYYRKHHGSQGNAYFIGIDAADMMIKNYNPQTQEVNHDTRNENKREELKALSAGFKMLIKEGAIGSINEGLCNYYAELGHTTLKSYRRWREEGFQVKRGCKALLLWGEPKTYRKENKPPADDEKEDSFFPVAYVFSNLQVMQI